tara:strand:- start:167 stop:520 length:354 start_codon:yes stop_codon:yes gene_type:complete
VKIFNKIHNLLFSKYWQYTAISLIIIPGVIYGFFHEIVDFGITFFVIFLIFFSSLILSISCVYSSLNIREWIDDPMDSATKKIVKYFLFVMLTIGLCLFTLWFGKEIVLKDLLGIYL